MDYLNDMHGWTLEDESPRDVIIAELASMRGLPVDVELVGTESCRTEARGRGILEDLDLEKLQTQFDLHFWVRGPNECAIMSVEGASILHAACVPGYAEFALPSQQLTIGRVQIPHYRAESLPARYIVGAGHEVHG